MGASLKVRGVEAGSASPKRIIPMLVQAMERSQSLAMAMESRGFQNDAPRRVAFETKLRVRDFVFLIGLNTSIVLGLIFL